MLHTFPTTSRFFTGVSSYLSAQLGPKLCSPWPLVFAGCLLLLSPFAIANTLYRSEGVPRADFRCEGEDDSAVLAEAVRVARGRAVVIAKGQTCAGRDLNIPNLHVVEGGRLKPVTGHKITLSGILEAGQYQIFANAFAGEGSIEFSGNAAMGSVYPQWWGAVGRSTVDQTKDDTKAIQAAFSSGAAKITIPNGHYMIDSVTKAAGQGKAGLNLVSNTTLTFSDGAYLHAKNNSSVGYNVLTGWKVTNVTIRGGKLVGDNITNKRTPDPVPSGYGLSLFGVTNVWVYNVTAQHMFADGFLIAYDDEVGAHPESQNVHLVNCISYANYRQGASVMGAKNSSIEGGKYIENAGSPPEDGIDIEPNPDIHGSGVGSIVSDFVVRDVVATGNKGSGIEIAGLNGTIARVDVLTNHSYENGQQGIVYRNGVNGKIQGNTTDRNGRNGISVYHSNHVDVSNNISSDNKQNGIIVQNPSGEPTQYIEVNSNTTNYNASAGLAVIGFPGKIVSDVNLRKNTSAGNSGNGVVLDFTLNVTVEDNRVLANSQFADARDDNVLVMNSATCSLLHNIIRRGDGAKQPRYGVSISSSTDTTVRNNDLVTAGKLEAIYDVATRSNVYENKLIELPRTNRTRKPRLRTHFSPLMISCQTRDKAGS